ncbi:hypothetical protein FYJ45_17780 [Eisenbergiella tayi]|uniref:Uncharacterized protein n=1 Tax=Eisenbergiella porci TaxID=2652274 RepID=A0A6N7W665_9FIRM|nr:hypothetical protein [Eisenbergiella porci]
MPAISALALSSSQALRINIKLYDMASKKRPSLYRQDDRFLVDFIPFLYYTHFDGYFQEKKREI